MTRKINIHGEEMIIVPKSLRKRFSGRDGVFISLDGMKALEHNWKTGCFQYLPEIFIEHFRKCLIHNSSRKGK